MGSSKSKNRGEIIAKCKAPGYCIKCVGSRHILLAGGGGSAKTGVANEIEVSFFIFHMKGLSFYLYSF